MIASDDWLQEEYEKIQKNQTLVTLQLKLEKIKKQKELFEQMKVRVSKLKSNTANKTIEFYFHKKDKNNKVDDKENVLEERAESEGDRDLILEEFEDKDCDSDGEETVEEAEDVITKVILIIQLITINYPVSSSAHKPYHNTTISLSHWLF